MYTNHKKRILYKKYLSKSMNKTRLTYVRNIQIRTNIDYEEKGIYYVDINIALISHLYYLVYYFHSK
jgi:hypothetical protein